jgi:hypothetical protein
MASRFRCFSIGGLALLLAAAWGPPPAQAQFFPGSDVATPDSVAERLGLPEGHAPKGALRRALTAPGWGQYYNRQYWKIPLVAAGLGGVVYALLYNWDRYFLYRDAYRYRRQRSGTFVPPSQKDEYDGEFGGEKYRAAYRTVVRQAGLNPGAALTVQGVRDARERFRRWAEMSILGVGVFWLLQVADAYVSAHLLGFELNAPSASGEEGASGDDASGDGASEKKAFVQVAPAPGGGVSAGVRLRF